MKEKCNLIIVDDNDILRDCTVETMTELGHNILCECKNGLEATEAFRIFHNTNPIIILDMEMPLQNGYDTFKSFQKIVLGFTNIIIFSTPSEKTAHQIQLLEELGCRFFEKPSSYEDMIPLLDELNDRPKRLPTKDEIDAERLSLQNETETINDLLEIADTKHKLAIEYTLELTKKRIAQIEN